MGRDRLTYAEIRRRYVEGERPLPEEIETELRADTHPSAQAILRAVDRRRRDRRSEGQRLRGILRFERALWATGVVRVAGVDEAGMSPLAGPVNGAEIPNRISLSVTPRTVGAGSLAPPTVARRAGASFADCATVGAIGRLPVVTEPFVAVMLVLPCVMPATVKLPEIS